MYSWFTTVPPPRMVRTGMAKLSSGVREPAGYPWIVVGVSRAVSGVARGVRSTFALFYVAMLTELAWGRGPTALGYSLSWLAFVAFAPVAGWLLAARPAARTRDVVTSPGKSTRGWGMVSEGPRAGGWGGG